MTPQDHELRRTPSQMAQTWARHASGLMDSAERGYEEADKIASVEAHSATAYRIRADRYRERASAAAQVALALTAAFPKVR